MRHLWLNSCMFGPRNTDNGEINQRTSVLWYNRSKFEISAVSLCDGEKVKSWSLHAGSTLRHGGGVMARGCFPMHMEPAREPQQDNDPKPPSRLCEGSDGGLLRWFGRRWTAEKRQRDPKVPSISFKMVGKPFQVTTSLSSSRDGQSCNLILKNVKQKTCCQFFYTSFLLPKFRFVHNFDAFRENLQCKIEKSVAAVV